MVRSLIFANLIKFLKVDPKKTFESRPSNWQYVFYTSFHILLHYYSGHEFWKCLSIFFLPDKLILTIHVFIENAILCLFFVISSSPKRNFELHGAFGSLQNWTKRIRLDCNGNPLNQMDRSDIKLINNETTLTTTFENWLTKGKWEYNLNDF